MNLAFLAQSQDERPLKQSRLFSWLGSPITLLALQGQGEGWSGEDYLCSFQSVSLRVSECADLGLLSF